MKILGICGSARTSSYNGQLLDFALTDIRSKGHDAEAFDVKGLPLPLFDEDYEKEHGMPANASALKAAIEAADGIVVACPEYNASITPMLKNLIDWATRGGNSWAGKPVVLLAASPGPMGGIRGLTTVRIVLAQINCHVISPQGSVGTAHQAFDENGGLKDERTASFIKGALDTFLSTAEKLKA